jgi:2-iminobutanoate/2-iminopropanoate deaminase
VGFEFGLQPTDRPHYTFSCCGGLREQLPLPKELLPMNRRIGIVITALVIAGISTVHGAYSQSSGQMERKAIKLPNKFVNAPFSDGIVFGDTLYLAGRIGIDPKTGKVPEKIEDEIKLLLDGEKEVLAKAGMTMDDLAYVQVFCTDLSLFEKFNPIYRTYFGKDYPARAFIGAGSLLAGGHFELQAIAVKHEYLVGLKDGKP